MSQFKLDMKFVRSLAELLKETNLSEIEYAEGDKRIRCVSSQPVIQVSQPAHAPIPAPSVSDTKSEKDNPAIDGTVITAPMVGTVYLSPEPSAPSFINIGDKVKKGDTLLIIEAMKVMNPIKASESGTIADIIVGDASPVEFGDSLIVIS